MIYIPGRIPIRIHPIFWLLIILIGWMSSGTVAGTAIWAVVILVSVLVHEYGHALTAVAFGQEAQIDLIGFGGVTQRKGRKIKLWQEFIIVLNGPLAGLLLALIAFLINLKLRIPPDKSYFKYAVLITLYANVIWTIINLLPVFPLDGGKLFSIILEAIWGIKGVRIAALLSAIFAVAIGLAFIASGWFLAGAFFLIFSFEGYRNWKSSLVMTVQDQDDDIKTSYKDAEAALKSGRQQEAFERFENLRKQSQQGIIYTAATEQVSKILSDQGRNNEAYQMLLPLEKQLSAEGTALLHQLAFLEKDWNEAARIGALAYQADPTYETALVNAYSHAILDQDRHAIGWLERAIEDGLPDVKQVLDRAEFNTIRNSPLFRKLQERYS